MSSVISFAYLTEILNLNISGTNADIYKCKQRFYSFMSSVVHLKNHRWSKNLIRVPLLFPTSHNLSARFFNKK